MAINKADIGRGKLRPKSTGWWAPVLFCALLGLFVFHANPADSQPKETATKLINVPAPEVLPHMNGGITSAARYGGEGMTKGPAFRVGVGLFDRAEFGLERVSTWKSVDHGSIYARLLLVEEGDYYPAIGVGIFDVVTDTMPNEDVGRAFAGSTEYEQSDATKNSAYAVLAKRIPYVGRAYIGMGGGRFIARWGQAEKLNGFFMGGEIDYGILRFIGEFDGRNLNAGLEGVAPKFRAGGMNIGINVLGGLKYVQNARPTSMNMGLRPAFYGRLEFVISQVNGLPKRKKSTIKAGVAAPKETAKTPKKKAVKVEEETMKEPEPVQVQPVQAPQPSASPEDGRVNTGAVAAEGLSGRQAELAAQAALAAERAKKAKLAQQGGSSQPATPTK